MAMFWVIKDSTVFNRLKYLRECLSNHFLRIFSIVRRILRDKKLRFFFLNYSFHKINDLFVFWLITLILVFKGMRIANDLFLWFRHINVFQTLKSTLGISKIKIVLNFLFIHILYHELAIWIHMFLFNLKLEFGGELLIFYFDVFYNIQ